MTCAEVASCENRAVDKKVEEISYSFDDMIRAALFF